MTYTTQRSEVSIPLPSPVSVLSPGSVSPYDNPEMDSPICHWIICEEGQGQWTANHNLQIGEIGSQLTKILVEALPRPCN